MPARGAGGHIERRQAPVGVRRLRQQARDGDIEIAVIRRAPQATPPGLPGTPGGPTVLAIPDATPPAAVPPPAPSPIFVCHRMSPP